MKEKTILVVDDTEFDRKFIAKTLTKKLECKVIEVSDAEGALQAIATHKIDMVLVDVDMPNISGEELVVKIRLKHAQDQLPIIMVSGKSADSIIVRCLKSGASDYITKPIAIDVAITRIVNHLKLSEAIGDRIKLKEMAALNAIIVTYNHEINSPLATATMSLEALAEDRTDEKSFARVVDAVARIADIVMKIRDASIRGEVEYETYSGATKMIKIK